MTCSRPKRRSIIRCSRECSSEELTRLYGQRISTVDQRLRVDRIFDHPLRVKPGENNRGPPFDRQNNAYSQAVITSGGRTIWLAGQASPQKDASGKSLAGDFDGHVRAIFAALAKTLGDAGGKLSDIVTMTAFITDDRYDRRFLDIRKEIFGDNFPASAMINIRSLAQPDLLIEIQSVAVIA